MFSITLNVTRKLRHPIANVRAWLRGFDATWMLMPKTAMNKDRQALPSENNVRLPRELGHANTIPQALREKSLAKR
jgi:hypothetical protein